MFVFRVVNKHTTEGLKTYLTNKCINLIDLKQLSHEGSKFKSFKVSVAKSSYSSMLEKSLWSSGVNVSRFTDFNKKH